MSAVATAIVGGAVVGGVMVSSATRSAANTQSEASQYATDAQIAFGEKSLAAEMKMAEMAIHAELEGAAMAAGATREAAKTAADAQIQSQEIQQQIAERALAQQMQMYQTARKDLQPYRSAGTSSLKTLKSMLKAGPGEFTEDPGYQFRLDQGNKNILATSSATGNLASGRTLKALQDYGQDYASYEYDKFIDRYYQSMEPYQNLVAIGENAAAMTGNMGIQTGQSMSNTLGNLSSGLAGTYNNLSNIYSSEGSSLAGIETNKGAGLASIYSGMGAAMSANYMNQGNALANNYLNQGNAYATGAINSANAWTSSINNALGTGAMLYGGSGWNYNSPIMSSGGGMSYNSPVF